MRKTVHEWLETHQQGRGMAKKKLGEVKSAGLPAAKPKKSKTTRARKKAKRKPR